jgi:soluble lytic murein transglycosylase
VPRRRALVLAAAAAFLLFPGFTGVSTFNNTNAAVAVGVLSPDDIQRYRQIFDDEANGRFAHAEALIGQLQDRSLVGYAEAQHYLSPYSSPSLSELVNWLQQYRDLPIADRIYALAVKRATVPVKRHHRVIGYRVTATVPTPTGQAGHLPGGGYEDSEVPGVSISSPAGQTALNQINAVYRTNPAQTEAILQTLASSGTAPASDIARLSVRVAMAYFSAGQDFQAFDVASRVNGTDRATAPMLDWVIGLAAYRMGRFDIAAAHFETLAMNGAMPNWTRSGAAFWAARSYSQAGQPLRVITLLDLAARERATFYGMIAERILGQDDRTAYADPVVDPTGFAGLMQIPAAHRAIALWQVGQGDYLHEEMARALIAMNYGYAQTFAALTRQMNCPDLELRGSEIAASRGIYLTGLFPVPGYSPSDGYKLDPSLVLAITRQESRFQADALSRAGARGLMQLMPMTAAHVAGGDTTISQMRDPSYNMSLGQKYLQELLDLTNGNVMQLAAAYNAGPGNLQKWLAASEGKGDDPLLFIESMPLQETRGYVKRVMTNYWIYSHRFGQAPSTLDDTAKGYWPRYPAARAMPAQSAPVPAAPQQPVPPAQPSTQQPQQPSGMVVSDASRY